MDFNDEYIEIINDFIKKLNNDYNKKNLSKYKEDFEELKNIIETYPGKISILYPYLNNIFQFAYANYQNNPSEFNSKILSICGSYIGEIFEFWKDYKSAIHAYSYSFFVDGELQSISKLISVQIFQLILNNRQLGDEIYHIISSTRNSLFLSIFVSVYFQS